MSEMYLEPPHLTVAVYSERPETETFAGICDLARELECTALNVVDVAPLGRDFELLSDLGGARDTLAVSPTRYAHLVAGQDPHLRVLRAGYSHRKFGSLVVEYVQRVGAGTHPIGVSMSSNSLGIPDSLWSGSQRRSAYEVADWSAAVLEATASKCDPLYGAIGVEFSLPTPQRLRDGKARLTTELFVSRRLLDRDQSLEEKLRRAFSGGDVMVWQNGLFFSGWAPYTSQRTTVDNAAIVIELAASALRAALS